MVQRYSWDAHLSIIDQYLRIGQSRFMKADQFMETGENQEVATGKLPAVGAWRSVFFSWFSWLSLLAFTVKQRCPWRLSWARGNTFAHGFLVPPISLWLIWRTRRSLIGLVPRANYGVLVLLVGAGFAWLLGEMATVAPLPVCVDHAGAGGSGNTRFRGHPEDHFSAQFLYFAVPFSEFICRS